MPYTYRYPRPSVTADIAVFGKHDQKTVLLLIQRKNDPFKDMWALPGGFMDMEETLEAAASRELNEETGLEGIVLKQFKTYSAIDRDPRQRTITTIFVAMLDQKPEGLSAGDDAADLLWFDIHELPELAFDHSEIVQEILKERF